MKALFGIRKGLLVAVAAVACCLACAGVAFAWLQGSAQLTQQNAVALSGYATTDAQAIPATISVKKHVESGSPEPEPAELATMSTSAPYFATVAKASINSAGTYDVKVTFDISGTTPARTAYTGYFTVKIGNAVLRSSDIKCTSESDADKTKTYTFQVRVLDDPSPSGGGSTVDDIIITPKRGAYLGSEALIEQDGFINMYLQ